MTHPLVAHLHSGDPQARREACEQAARDPSAVLLVDALCATLADEEKSVARAASDALARIGARDREVRPRVLAVLRGTSREAHWWAALTLARIEPPTLQLLPTLLDALEHADREIRWPAAKLLVDLGRLEDEVLPVLLHFAGGDERPAARRMAVFALRELAPDRPETTRALLDASRAPDPEVRRAALTALAAMLEETESACSRLVEVLAGDTDPASRGLAAAALGALAARHAPGGSRADEALRRAAEVDVAPQVRRAARTALAAGRAGAA